MESVLVTIALAIFGYIGAKLVDILSGIKDSIEKLNIQIAVVIERTDSHEKRIERLEEKTHA